MQDIKSIKVNAILNSIQMVLRFIFPLITFPYISRALGIEQLGRYNFANAFISWFVLLADFGIKTYAMREGAEIRNSKSTFERFSNEIFSLNIGTTFISYIFLIFLTSFFSALHNYKEIIFILSFQIIFITLGRSWLFNIYEDFLFITVRNICFQIISMILALGVVKNSNDVYKYTIIVTLSTISNEILNVFISKKYSKMKIVFITNRKHIKSLLYLLSTSVSITIYQSSDMIMLGIIGTDFNVGIYSVSVKIYNILKQFVAAILFVTIPRFSFYLGKKMYVDYQNLFTKVFNILTLILLPISIGIIMICKETVILVAGAAYSKSALSLALLSFAMIFNLYTYMLGYCILLPNREDKFFLKTTLCGALVNVAVNFFLIPYYFQNAAAFSTIIAEICTLILCVKRAKKYVRFNGVFHNLIYTLIGCGWIAFIGLIVHLIFDNILIVLCMIILLSILGYCAVQIIFKNHIVKEIFLHH